MWRGNAKTAWLICHPPPHSCARRAATSWTSVLQPAFTNRLQTEIELFGDVVITSRDTGLVMTAQAVQANLEAGNMISETPVRVESDNGVIVSKGMQVTERGKMIIFTGKTRMTIHNGAKGL